MGTHTALADQVSAALELTGPKVQKRFALRIETISAFNAYIAGCEQRQGPIHLIMREQARKQMEWRIYRRVTGKHAIQHSASFLRASNFDKNDLFSAAQEFEEEIAKFIKWKMARRSGPLPASQQAGFGNDHQAEWTEIASWWDKVRLPDPAVTHFFDNFVHDSRAWFKLFPGNPDNEQKALDQLKSWHDLRKLAQANLSSPMLTGRTDYKTVSDRLSPAQRAAADQYEQSGAIPRMTTAGREPWESSFGWMAGARYLRYRKVFGGSDSDLLS